MGRKLKKVLAITAAAAVAASTLPLGAALSADAALYYETEVYSPVYKTKGDILSRHEALIKRFYPNSEEYETGLREDVINYYRWLAGVNDVQTMISDMSIPDSVIDEIHQKSLAEGLTDHAAYNGVELGGSISMENEPDMFFAKTPTYERFTMIDIMRALINDDSQQHNYRQAVLSRNVTHSELVIGNNPDFSGSGDCTGLYAVWYVNQNSGKFAKQYNLGFYSDNVTAWPSNGAFPVEEIDTDTRWSVGWDTGRQGYYNNESDLYVRITDLETGTVYKREMGNGLSLDTTCGAMLTFDPPAETDYKGKSYYVFVGGLKEPGTRYNSVIAYQVDFMSYDDPVIDDVHEPYDYNVYLYTPPEDEAYVGVPFVKEYNTYNVRNASVRFSFKKPGSKKWKLLQESSSTTLSYTFTSDDAYSSEEPFYESEDGYPIAFDDLTIEGMNDAIITDDITDFYTAPDRNALNDYDYYIKAELIENNEVVDTKITSLSLQDPTDIFIDAPISTKLGGDVRFRSGCYVYERPHSLKSEIRMTVKYKKAGDPDSDFKAIDADDEGYYSFTPTTTGEYEIKADAVINVSKWASYDEENGEDVYEPVITLNSTNTATVSVTDKKVTAKAKLAAPAGQPGETVEIFSDAEEGASPYHFEYYYRRQGARVWNVFAHENVSFSTMKARFTPKSKGVYEFKVVAADSSDPSETDETILTYYVTDELVNNSDLSAKRVAPGTMITFYGRATGGSGEIRYLYSYKRKTARAWTNMGGDNAAYLTLKNVGEYDAMITAVDAVGNRTEKKFTITVTNDLVNQTTLNAVGGAALGSRIVVNNAANGGAGGYTFVTKYNRVGSRTWNTLQGTGFRPSQKGVYNIVSTVTDKAGASQEVSFVIEVVDPVVNNSTLTANKPGTTEFPAGTRFTLTGSAAGGSGEQLFKYYYKRSTALNWSVLPAGIVTLRNAGSYKFRAVAIDPTGMETEKVFDVTIK